MREDIIFVKDRYLGAIFKSVGFGPSLRLGVTIAMTGHNAT